MRVRPAGAQDIDQISAVAGEAWWDTYAEFLDATTIEAFLRNAYSPRSLRRRVESHPVFVAVQDGSLVAFADAVVRSDRVVLLALYTLPSFRDQGAGTALLQAVRVLAPTLPVCADVLLGNHKGEVFYEAKGFVPGEIIHGRLFGQPVIERRWWLAPRDEPAA